MRRYADTHAPCSSCNMQYLKYAKNFSMEIVFPFHWVYFRRVSSSAGEGV